MSDNETKPTKVQVDLEDVRHAIEVLQWAKRERETLEARLRELEDGAKSLVQKALGDTGDLGMLDGQPVIDWRRYETTQFRQKDFKRDNPHLAAQYTDRVTRRQFHVLTGDVAE